MHTLCMRVFLSVVSQKGWFSIQHILGLECAFMDSGAEAVGVFPLNKAQASIQFGWRVNRVKRFTTKPRLCSFKKFAHLSSWQRATWPT